MRIVRTLFIFIFLLYVSFLPPKIVHASFLDDLVNSTKRFFTKPIDNPSQLSIPVQQEIVLTSSFVTPDGKNMQSNQQNAGDMVVFTYTLTNSTDTEYSFLILDTKVAKEQLHFIHDVTGANGMIIENSTIQFPNIRLNPRQTKVISFTARINYSEDRDLAIGTEPVIVTNQKSILTKSIRKEFVAKKKKLNENASQAIGNKQ